MIDLASKSQYNICMNLKRLKSKIEVALWKGRLCSKVGRKWNRLDAECKFVAMLFTIQATAISILMILNNA